MGIESWNNKPETDGFKIEESSTDDVFVGQIEDYESSLPLRMLDPVEAREVAKFGIPDDVFDGSHDDSGEMQNTKVWTNGNLAMKSTIPTSTRPSSIPDVGSLKTAMSGGPRYSAKVANLSLRVINAEINPNQPTVN